MDWVFKLLRGVSLIWSMGGILFAIFSVISYLVNLNMFIYFFSFIVVFSILSGAEGIMNIARNWRVLGVADIKEKEIVDDFDLNTYINGDNKEKTEIGVDPDGRSNN